ncbi:hypothetical protein HK100_003104 [Physocladia obscura]|uniref:Transmembrane protein n=1 Tax=Physocladia obscura TaxID=109957 RepID=A0AAD5XDS3_9FUNG|nr:hypothetical protein HK100_003104 [Physocladia obscura]
MGQFHTFSYSAVTQIRGLGNPSDAISGTLTFRASPSAVRVSIEAALNISTTPTTATTQTSQISYYALFIHSTGDTRHGTEFLGGCVSLIGTVANNGSSPSLYSFDSNNYSLVDASSTSNVVFLPGRAVALHAVTVSENTTTDELCAAPVVAAGVVAIANYRLANAPDPPPFSSGDDNFAAVSVFKSRDVGGAAVGTLAISRRGVGDAALVVQLDLANLSAKTRFNLTLSTVAKSDVVSEICKDAVFIGGFTTSGDGTANCSMSLIGGNFSTTSLFGQTLVVLADGDCASTFVAGTSVFGVSSLSVLDMPSELICNAISEEFNDSNGEIAAISLVFTLLLLAGLIGYSYYKVHQGYRRMKSTEDSQMSSSFSSVHMPLKQSDD